jgi:hypothetical protein
MKTLITAHYFILVIVGMGGFFHPVYSDSTEGTLKITPALNTEATAQVGEEILKQAHTYEREAIRLSEEIKFGKEGSYILTPGIYLREGQSDGWETYALAEGPEAGKVIKAPEAITLQGSFIYSMDGKTIGLITNFYQAIHAKANGITRTTRPSLLNDRIQRALVYGGKVGNKIKLGYREIWQNITRPSQIQFIEHDLTGSKLVKSNGAHIEVIEATNEFIRYRIIKSLGSAEE